jgi:hypothetical protein
MANSSATSRARRRVGRRDEEEGMTDISSRETHGKRLEYDFGYDDEVGYRCLVGPPTAPQSPSAQSLYVPPEIELSRDRLIWSPGLSRVTTGPIWREYWIEKAPRPSLLEGFVRLADAPPEQIHDFASKWGVLAVCRHGLPSSHASTCRPLRVPGRTVVYWEPLKVWRHFASEAALSYD